MCELNSPPFVGSAAGVFWNPANNDPPPAEGTEFTAPWGYYDVTYRVDQALSSRKDGVKRRLSCTVMRVDRRK